MLVYFLMCLYWFAGIEGLKSVYKYEYYEKIDGWLKLHLLPVTWNNAVKKCYMEGAVLASPSNKEMLSSMLEIMNATQWTKHCAIFTGVHNTFTNGDYYTTDGKPFYDLLDHWRIHEQAHTCERTMKDYLTLMSDGSFGDANKTDIYPFICHRKRDRMNINTCGTFDPDYALDQRSGSCYKFHSIRATWIQAVKICATEGGYLAVINSMTEANIINQIMLKRQMFGNKHENYTFIGIIDWNEYGTWSTIHGQSLHDAGYVNWLPGTPTYARDSASNRLSKCGVAVIRFDQPNCSIANFWCDVDTLTFVCEKSPVVFGSQNPNNSINNEQPIIGEHRNLVKV